MQIDSIVFELRKRFVFVEPMPQNRIAIQGCFVLSPSEAEKLANGDCTLADIMAARAQEMWDRAHGRPR